MPDKFDWLLPRLIKFQLKTFLHAVVINHNNRFNFFMLETVWRPLSYKNQSIERVIETTIIS